MLSLNRPATKYAYKMLWYENLGSSNNRIIHSNIPRTFFADYAKSQDVGRLGLNQGLINDSFTIETNTSLSLKINDKVIFNGKQYIIKQVIESQSSLSGSRYTNAPATFIKYVVMN